MLVIHPHTLSNQVTPITFTQFTQIQRTFPAKTALCTTNIKYLCCINNLYTREKCVKHHLLCLVFYICSLMLYICSLMLYICSLMLYICSLILYICSLMLYTHICATHVQYETTYVQHEATYMLCTHGVYAGVCVHVLCLCINSGLKDL